MKPRLLITRRVFDEVIGALSDRFDIEANQADDEWSVEETARRAADKEALLVVASDQVPAAVIEAAPGLRMIATGSVGFNHIDLAACARRGIVVSNTPDVLTEATADMAWTLLMATARRVTEAERWLREGHWDRWAWDQFLGADIHGATLGILGMGRIGSAIARRARGFDMQILYSNRSAAPNEQELGAVRVDRDSLLAAADHVMLVLPYSNETHHTIGAAELERMKPSATLINIARGGIVDDEALAAALAAGRIAGAGLDVYEDEPRIAPALLAQSRVVLTPHIGSATRSTRMAMAMLAARNLLAFFGGEPLPTPVSLPRD
jgi:gluconate 2-dehydrogenase